MSRPPCYCGQPRLLIRKEKKVPTRVSVSLSPDHANLLILIRYQRTAPERRIPSRIDRHLWQLYTYLSLGVASAPDAVDTSYWTVEFQSLG